MLKTSEQGHAKNRHTNVDSVKDNHLGLTSQ